MTGGHWLRGEYYELGVTAWLLGGYDWGHWLLGGYDWSSLALRRGYWLLVGYDWGSLAPRRV